MGPFIESVFEKLRRHPKRIIFPEGKDVRILQAAAQYVQLKLGPALVLGKREEIALLAAEHGIPLTKIHVIDIENSQDMPIFVKKLQTLPRYKGITEEDAIKILSNPNYFSTMMLVHGQCDGLVAGTGDYSGNILRALFQLIKPLPGIKSISSCMVMEVPNCIYGDRGTLFFADAGVIPDPTVEQLAHIAVETGRLKRQLTGQVPRVAMLSYSTKGSAQTQDTEKIVAATALAKQRSRDIGLDLEIDGELQVDAALVPEIAAVKCPNSLVAGKADVLIFPDLNAANISVKLVQRLAQASAYGQILIGLEKPAAELSRGATVEDIVGIASIVALQAVEYRKLYPHQDDSVEPAESLWK